MRTLPVVALLFALGLCAQEITSTAIGHEYREDDSPTLAVCPDGTAWVAWLSFEGSRDDVVIRQYTNGHWGALQWVPATSGDNWLPQAGCDARNRAWVVWSQQADRNWDIYARSFDPAAQQWGQAQRISNDAQPDVNPRIASDGKGKLAAVWQGFRSGHSNIFTSAFDGERWSRETHVTNTAANDWEPAAAFDSSGHLWVVYDSYRNGNYDVFAAQVGGPEIPVAHSPRFETRATVAADTSGRIWVAWEEGGSNWGKDNGYRIRDRSGKPLGGVRAPRIACFAEGKWQTTEAPLQPAFGPGNTYQPHVFSDGKGSVWLMAKKRLNPAQGAANRGFWEYYVTHFDGSSWSKATAVPNSKGRSSTRLSAALLNDGSLLTAWSTDNRLASFYHRPQRQQVYAGSLPAPTPTANAKLAALTAPPEDQDYKPVHPNEIADLQNIRAYRSDVDGQQMRIVRGDFHRHTELSWDGGGTADGNLQDFYRYMIDVASMDFGASTDHQGGAWPYWWWYTQKMTDMYHVPGAYVPIFGYERSATYPFGHRNVFFANRSDSRVTPFHLKAGAPGFGIPAQAIGDEPGVGSGDLTEDDTRLLYEEVRPRRGLVIPHTTATRMGTSWGDNDPALEPVVEIFQGARTNYEQLGAPFAADEQKDAQHIQNAGYEAAGFVNNAWAKGYKLGIITSSDHGSTHISYALVYTNDYTRQGILDAIHKRHTYGAMDNIILDVRMGKHFMGDEFALKKAEPIHVRVRAPRTVARVDIIKDSQVIYSAEPKQQSVDLDFLDKGDVAGRHYYYVRLQQDDALLAWSSPFFVNYP